MRAAYAGLGIADGYLQAFQVPVFPEIITLLINGQIIGIDPFLEEDKLRLFLRRLVVDNVILLKFLEGLLQFDFGDLQEIGQLSFAQVEVLTEGTLIGAQNRFEDLIQPGVSELIII